MTIQVKYHDHRLVIRDMIVKWTKLAAVQIKLLPVNDERKGLKPSKGDITFARSKIIIETDRIISKVKQSDSSDLNKYSSKFINTITKSNNLVKGEILMTDS